MEKRLNEMNNKKQYLFLLMLVVLTVVGCAYKPFLSDREGKIWLMIEPRGCTDWSVPLGIYLDDTAWPNKPPMRFPMNFNIKQDMYRYHKNLALDENEIQKRIKDELFLFEKNYRPFEGEVVIYDAKKGSLLDKEGNPLSPFTPLCEACGCPRGYTLYILVLKEDAQKLFDIGYKIAK